MRSKSTQHTDDAPPPTVPARFDGPQTRAGPNRRIASPHASRTTAAITSDRPCISTTPSPLYPHVSCAVCLRLVPHLMSTRTHTSPCVLMAPRRAWAPNDTPRPTANTSHTPYSHARPQTTPHVIPARPHTSLTLCPRRVPPPHHLRAPLWENVLFGAGMRTTRHGSTQSCALTQDLEMLPQGDRTESGEKGINLRCALVQCVMN